MKKQRELATEINNNIFSQKLAFLLDKNKTPQKELAEVLGVTRQMVSLYANGQSLPDIEKLQKIANFYNVTVSYLLGDSDCKEAKNEDIHLAIGLTEESIERLRTINENGYADIIDKIINNDNIHAVISQLNELKQLDLKTYSTATIQLHKGDSAEFEADTKPPMLLSTDIIENQTINICIDLLRDILKIAVKEL